MIIVGVVYNLIFLLRIIPTSNQMSGWFGLPSLIADFIIYFGWLGDASPTIWTNIEHFIIVVLEFFILGLLLGLIYGKIKNKDSKYQKIAIVIFLLIILLVTYFAYNSYQNAGIRNNIEGQVLIKADGSKSLYKNGQWQPY